ncbi:hypothetical protein A3Q56_05147, partial [Intoshia linei]
MIITKVDIDILDVTILFIILSDSMTYKKNENTSIERWINKIQDNKNTKLILKNKQISLNSCIYLNENKNENSNDNNVLDPYYKRKNLNVSYQKIIRDDYSNKKKQLFQTIKNLEERNNSLCEKNTALEKLFAQKDLKYNKSSNNKTLIDNLKYNLFKNERKMVDLENKYKDMKNSIKNTDIKELKLELDLAYSEIVKLRLPMLQQAK